MFRLFEIENEENALICMKIIMDLHRYYRPPINAGMRNFLVTVKQLYSHLPAYVPRIFEQQSPLVVKDLRKMTSIDQIYQRINLEQMLQNTFTQIAITDTRPEDKTQPAVNYTFLPRSSISLKVLAEVPLMVGGKNSWPVSTADRF
jgi:transformation/transcription domain-associated protein